MCPRCGGFIDSEVSCDAAHHVRVKALFCLNCGLRVTRDVFGRVMRRHLGIPAPIPGGRSQRLSKEKVRRIKARLEAREKQVDIAQDEGVSPWTISAIKRGRAWVDI